jgi:hypothetical protein
MTGRGGRLLLAVISTVLAVAALELGLRVVDYDPNPAPAWRFHPELGWTADPRSTRADYIQPDGFRYDPRPAHLRGVPAASVRTLLVLGDSFTAALDFPYYETLPGLLEAGFGATGAPWRVVSVACDDWGQAQQLIALQLWVDRIRPDAVVLQTFPLNDFCNNSMVLAGTCSLQDDHRPYFVRDGDRLIRTWRQPARAWLRIRSRLFGLLEGRLGEPVGRLPQDWMSQEPDQDLRRRAYFRFRARAAGLEQEGVVYSLLPPPHQPPPIAEAWEVTRRMAREFGKVAAERGIPWVVLVIPFLKTFEPEWQELVRVFQAPVERDFATRSYETFFAEAGARVVSMRRLVECGSRPYQDYFISPADGHLSRAGHAACAEWIRRELPE